jgi:N-acetylglucosamine-6-sulfatase
VFNLIRISLLAALLLPVIVTAPTQAQSSQPDIIAIMTDDMRSDDWRMLDDTSRLVGGTWYPNFVFTTPLCCPFRATFHTGQYAHNHGILKNNPGWRLFREQEDDTLAVALDAVGYHTAYVGKYMNNYEGGTPPGWDDWRATIRAPYYSLKGEYSTDVFRDQAVDIVSHAPRDAPLFLTVGFHAPHNPWIPAARHQGIDVGPTINNDDAERKRTLLAVDEAVMAIADAFGSRWDEACVFVFTDNGLLLGEHDTRLKAIWWDPATRVPMRARCQGLSSGTDSRLVGSIDLAPTILHAAGARLKREVDGRPLQETWDRNGILIESWNTKSGNEERLPFAGIKGKDWLYVVPEGQPPRLYRDPEEIDDVISSLTEIEQDAYAAWLADLRDCAGETCRDADETQRVVTSP